MIEFKVAGFDPEAVNGITIKRRAARIIAAMVWKMMALAGTRYLFSRATPTGRRLSIPPTNRRRAYEEITTDGRVI